MLQRERHIQAHGVRLLRSLGATVRTLGTTRRRSDYQGTMQSPGWPDVRAWLPPRADELQALAFWWEVKAEHGRLSAEQAAFHEDEARAGNLVVVGGLDALIAFLMQRGRITADSISHEHHLRPQ